MGRAGSCLLIPKVHHTLFGVHCVRSVFGRRLNWRRLC
jgi:hypothetical protein